MLRCRIGSRVCCQFKPSPTLGVTEHRSARGRSDLRLETSRTGHGFRLRRSRCKRCGPVASCRVELSTQTFSNPPSREGLPTTRKSLDSHLRVSVVPPRRKPGPSCQQHLLSVLPPCPQPGIEAIVRNAAVNALAAAQQVREPCMTWSSWT